MAHLSRAKGSTSSLASVKEKPSTITFSVPEKKAASDAKNMVLSAFEQMHRQKGSLVSLFDASQLPALSRVCTVRRLAEGEKLMRQGEVATFLGFVMTGRLKVELHGTHATSGNLGPGDIVGEMELCHGEIGKVERRNTVEATLASTIAELTYEDFSSFVESLGSRMAKKVSKTMANTVLDRFVHNEQQADAEDRKRLTNIGTQRRNGFCMPMPAGLEDVAPIIVHDRVRNDEHLAPNMRNEGAISRTSSSADRGVKSGAGVRHSLDDLMKESLATVLTRIGLFSSMDLILKEELLDSFFLYEPAGGEVVVSTGEPQSLFYVIYRGSCGVYDVPAEFVHLAFSNVTSGGEVSAQSVSNSSPARAKLRAALHKQSSGGGPTGSFDDLDKAKAGDVALTRDASRKAFAEGEFSFKALSESPSISPRDRKGQKSPGSSFRKVQGMGESKKWGAEDSMSKMNFRRGESNVQVLDFSQPKLSPIERIESARERMIRDGSGFDIHSSFGAAMMKPGGGLRKDKDKSKKKIEFQVVSTLYGGDTFNEMSLIFDSESKVTIRAMQRDVQLLAVDSKLFRSKRMAYEQQRRTEISQALLLTPWGKLLPSETLNNLVDACELVKYETGRRIVSEWDEDANNYFYQVVSGSAMEVVEKKSAADRMIGSSVHTSRQSKMDWTSYQPTRSRRFSSIQVDFEKVLREYFKGDYFCEFVLHTVSVEMDINKVHLNPTVVCEQPCICLRLARNVFRSTVGSLEALIDANTKKIEGLSSSERLERRPSLFERRPSAFQRRPSVIERHPSAIKAQGTDGQNVGAGASPQRRRPSGASPRIHSPTNGLHPQVDRLGKSRADVSLSPQLGGLTPPKQTQDDASGKVPAIDLGSAAFSISFSNAMAGQASNTKMIEPLAPGSDKREASVVEHVILSSPTAKQASQPHSPGKELDGPGSEVEPSHPLQTQESGADPVVGLRDTPEDDGFAKVRPNRADLDPFRSPSDIDAIQIDSEGDQGTEETEGEERQADKRACDDGDVVIVPPDTTLSASTGDLGNAGSADYQDKSISAAEVSLEMQAGYNASKGPKDEEVFRQVVSDTQPDFDSRKNAVKTSTFYGPKTRVTSDEIMPMATHQRHVVAEVMTNMIADVVSGIAGDKNAEIADTSKDSVSVAKDPWTKETVFLGDQRIQAEQGGASHVIDTGMQDRGFTGNEKRNFGFDEPKAGDQFEATEAGDQVDIAKAGDQVEIIPGQEYPQADTAHDGLKDDAPAAFNSQTSTSVQQNMITSEIISKSEAKASDDDVAVAEGPHAESHEGLGSADKINAAGQSDVLLLDDDDVETPQAEDDEMNSEFGSSPVARQRRSSFSGSVGLPPRSPGTIGMTTLDSVAESLLHVAAGEIGDGFARRSSGGVLWQGSRPSTQGGRPKSQGFGSRPMTQGSSSGPSRTPSRPGTHGPSGLDIWGMHFDPDQSRPNTVGSNRSLPRGENLTMTPQGSLPPFRSPAHTPSLSSATSRAQSADPTKLNHRRLRASTTLVAAADEFAIPMGAQVDPALGSDDGDASSGDDDTSEGMHQSTPLPQQSDEFVQSHDRDRTEEKSVKFPSMEGDVSTQDASSRQSLARIAATAASRAETAAVAEDQRARTARSGQGRWYGPGPGAYDLQNQNVRGGRWSVSHRETGPPVTSTPGPGQYDVVKTPKVLRLNQLRASTAMGSLGDVSRERSDRSLRGFDDPKSEAQRLRRIQQEFSMRSREEVRLTRKTREAEERRADERRIRRGEREKARPNTVYTSVISKHMSGRWDDLLSELPPTEDLAWELRAFEPVKRAYRDNGYEF